MPNARLSEETVACDFQFSMIQCLIGSENGPSSFLLYVLGGEGGGVGGGDEGSGDDGGGVGGGDERGDDGGVGGGEGA